MFAAIEPPGDFTLLAVLVLLLACSGIYSEIRFRALKARVAALEADAEPDEEDSGSWWKHAIGTDVDDWHAPADGDGD
jgi:hypothetical protein